MNLAFQLNPLSKVFTHGEYKQFKFCLKQVNVAQLKDELEEESDIFS